MRNGREGERDAHTRMDKKHWNAVKWILRYLKGTSNMCLRFGSGKPQLDGFTDSDMSADVDTSRSTSGYVMTYEGGVVSWQSRLQKTVALSTTEAEYMAAVEAPRRYNGVYPTGYRICIRSGEPVHE